MSFLKKALFQSSILLAVASLSALLIFKMQPGQPPVPAAQPGTTGTGSADGSAAPVDELAIIIEAALDLEDVIWIDARSENDFSKEHIPGAINLREGDWEEGFAQLMAGYSPERTIVTYCSSSCGLSRQIAQRLREELQQPNIYFLTGGLPAWQAKNP